MKVEPTVSRAQYKPAVLESCSAPKTVTSAQPTVSTTSKLIMPMASQIGVLKGRRDDIISKHSSPAAGASSGEGGARDVAYGVMRAASTV